MFGLFAKKVMNEEAAKSFWEWFAEKEEWIIDCISNHDSAFVWAIDEKLKPIFPYFKGELEFQLGYNNGVGEFFFFHFKVYKIINFLYNTSSYLDNSKFISKSVLFIYGVAIKLKFFLPNILLI